MNSATLVGYSFDADTYCVRCTMRRYPQLEDTTDVQDSEGNTLYAILHCEEFESQPYCADCEEPIEVQENFRHTDDHPRLLIIHEHYGLPTVTCPDAPDTEWLAYNMRGYMDQTTCDCCTRIVQAGYQCMDGGEFYCEDCIEEVEED